MTSTTRVDRTLRRAPAARGFSLTELMVTVAIASIFMGVAAPSLTSVFRGNRIIGEASSLVSDMQFARAEAIQRGSAVSLCPSSNGTTCLTTNTWHSGWIVFNDVNGNGIFDSSVDTALRVRGAFKGTDTFVSAQGSTAITFNREGFVSNTGAATTVLALHTSDNVSNLTRCVSINLGGRITTLTAGQSTCT